MKRKLPSSHKGKGNQQITKFFKSLIPQGSKKSCNSMNNVVKEKTTKETEFRTPLLEKFQAAKKSGSTDSSTMLSLDSSSSHVNNQAATSPVDSSVVADKSVLDGMSVRSAEKDNAAETSAMDCDGTFHSAYEEVDTSYYSCGGSFADSLNNDTLNDSGNKGEILDFDINEGSFTKELDKHGSVQKESKAKDLSIGESSSCNGHIEGEQDFGVDVSNVEESAEDCNQMSKSSAGLLTKEADSRSCLESKTDDLNTDQYSKYGNHTKREHNDISDDFQEEEHDKDSDSLSDVHFNEVANDHGDSSEESGSFDAKEEEQQSSCEDLKEDHDAESEQINKPLNDIYFQEDSNEDVYADGSDSSDEDLLTPPRFLYENTKLKPDIRTPEKGIAPAYATPSPISREAIVKEDKSKYKLSFDKLIADKAKHRERDAELAEMEAELLRGIENGGIGQMQVPSTFSDIESEEELTDDGRDLRDCTLPQDIKKFLVDVHDFSEELPGEDVFPMFHPYVTSQDFPCLSMVPHPGEDTFEAKLMSASDTDLQELLCGGWILQHYLDKPCPSEVAEWLFQIMCRHRDQHIISSAFKVLWVMLEAATENRDDIPQDSRGTSWVPSIKKVLRELLSFGATVPRLYPRELVNQLNVKDILSNENSSEDIQMEEESVNGEPQTECFPVVNIMHLVQFLTHCLQRCPRSYTVQDLRNLMVLMCRLALDLRLQTVVFDIEMCIAAMLNCFGETQWPDEIKELCSIVAKLSTHHPNLLYLVQVQPPSTYGIELQRRLSLTLLHWLVLKFVKQEQPGKVLVDERCNVTVPDAVEVSSLVELVAKIKPGENSDYFLLHTIISLVSLAVGSEDLPSKERASLETLTNKLRTLNGEIKDPRAAFMNRTKVKDLLVRTILRLAYMIQCIKPSRENHITTYFEYSSSDYQVELLKENVGENVDELPGNEEEEAMTGVQETDLNSSR
ncbi:SMC5-SMC6 complex localization factor protein 2-like [Oculina patagonica]